MLSPPKPLDEMQPNLVSYSNEWGMHQHFFGPTPWEPWGGVMSEGIRNVSEISLSNHIVLTLVSLYNLNNLPSCDIPSRGEIANV